MKKVEFEEDIKEEEFYEKWDYDIDEQPVHLRHYVMGNLEEYQLSLDDFIVKYGFGCIDQSDCHDENEIINDIDNDSNNNRESEKQNENITIKVSDVKNDQENTKQEDTKQKTLFSFYKKSESTMTNSIVYT